MKEASTEEIILPRENYLSKKSRFLLWSCFIIPMCILLAVIIYIIFSRIHATFYFIDDNSSIETTVTPEQSTKTTRRQLITTKAATTSNPNTISRAIPCNPMKFSNYSSYSYGVNPWAISSGYLDEDCYLDIVVGSQGDEYFAFYYGNENGTFQSTINHTASKSHFLMIKDMNNDNKLDIVATLFETDSIGIIINYGNRSFSSLKQYPVGNYDVHYNPYWLDVSDFNNNSLMDVVVVNDHDSSITVFYDYHNLSFSYSHMHQAGHDCTAVSVADFNKDSYIDFVVTDYSDNTISIYINEGNGLFKPRKAYSAGITPWGVKVADFNNDSFIDIVTANYAVGMISILFNDGGGHFYKRDSYYINGLAVTIALADLNNDTFLDIMAVTEGDGFIYILLNNQDGTFLEYQKIPTDTGLVALTVGDFNNDRKIDIAAGSDDTGNLNILLNQC
ncbi:unnamed protein product [Adineta ricciae]|uniref:VCBS repeat-containing protein n=1 Tax=Adineta ricciae TaxID=249248 RepID=A0A815V3H4_ADIRI|nr:unnamed protein product [Adineta ricciae]